MGLGRSTQEKEAFRRWKGRGSNPELRGFVLYDALMHTGEGFKILERNSRGGNTEQLCLFTTIQDDLVDVCFRMSEGLLKGIRFSRKASVVTCVVPLGYGIEGATAGAGDKMDLDRLTRSSSAPKASGYSLWTSSCGGTGTYMGSSRSVAVVGVSDSLEDARLISLSGVDAFKGPVRSRRDIASALDIRRCADHMKELRGRRTSA